MLKIPQIAAPRCSCGAAGELRRCAGNAGVAWRCPRCMRVLSEWLPHIELLEAAIDIDALPDWNAAPDVQMGLSL